MLVPRVCLLRRAHAFAHRLGRAAKMGTIWFRMRSELKWREVEVTSTFITVGELRGLICDKLALDQRTDTVTVVSETDTDPFPDAKQLPRGSRVRVIRTTFEHLERLKTQLEEAEKKDTDTAAAAEDKGEAAPAPEPAKADESEDEFGPSVFDVDAQRRYEAKQAAAEAARLPAHPAGLPVSTVATDEPSDQPGPSAVAGAQAPRTSVCRGAGVAHLGGSRSAVVQNRRRHSCRCAQRRPQSPRTSLSPATTRTRYPWSTSWASATGRPLPQ